MKVEAKFSHIGDLKFGSSVVMVDKETNEQAVMTKISFTVDADPTQLLLVQYEMAQGHPVTVVFDATQGMLDMELPKKE